MRNYSVIAILISIILFITNSCTTQKNTPITRAYHNLTAHYNVFFNGKTALNEAIKTINQKCKYDYLNILPIFPYQCPDAKKLVNSTLNRVLEKAAKTIKNHSITAKPNYKNLSNLTKAQIKFYKKYEYVKWIDDSYLLIGIANLYKGDIDKSQQAFHKIIDKYYTENSYYDAQLWLARTYIIQERYKDASALLDKLSKDSKFPKRLKKDLYLTWTDLYIKQKKYDKAIENLQKAIKLEHNKYNKAKYLFILAQLYFNNGNVEQAKVYLKKVIKLAPSYEMVFHAKLYQALTLSDKDNPQNIEKQLTKMLKDEKNEEYLDKIYFVLAQLNLQQKDTTAAINYFKLALKHSNDPTQKGLTYLTLADLLFKQRNYILAGQYYDSTLQVLPKNYINYQKIQKQSTALIELANNLKIAHTQDSLLKLAQLPKEQVLKIIDSIINSLKEKEAQQQQNNFDMMDPESQRYNMGLPTQQSKGGKWYFYNPMLISRGKQIFKQRWGNRKLEDNWRRKIKSQVENPNSPDQQLAQQNNKYSREFYLNQIPYTDSAKQLAQNKIIEALFNAALIYENNLQDYKDAIKIYKQLLTQYPDNVYKLDIYYHLYLIYKKLNNIQEANKYKSLIINQFPNSKFALMLKSPEYTQKLLSKEQQAQRALMLVIKLYEKQKYQQTLDSIEHYLSKYQGSSIIPYLLFIKAKALGSIGKNDSLVQNLKLIINQYPTSKIASLAKDILNQIQNINKYSYNPQQNHYLLIPLNPNISTKKLNAIKFQIFKLANEFYKDKVFKTEIADINGKKTIILKEFDNLPQAINFIRYLKQNWQENVQYYLITPTNLDLLQKDKTWKYYILFYNKNYKL